MTDWENVISFESLYKAHFRARLGKRHKKEVIEFENELSKNLWELHYELKYNKYIVGGYHKFKIYDPKEREIQAISYRDRIVQHSLCDNYLMPLLEKHLIYDNTACRKGKGTNFAILRLKKFMLMHYKKYGNSGYFVKIDVKKYFDSIDHSVVKEKLKKLVKDENLLNLLFNILDSYNHKENKGIPMGNQSSQCIALLYLDKLDRYFKEVLKIKFYIRYMDDIVLIVENKKQARECLIVAEKILNKEKLILNPKSKIVAFGRGVEFLGWRFFINNQRLVQKIRKSTKRRIVAKIKTIKYKVKIKKFPESRLQNSLISYAGFLKHGNAYNFLRQISA